MMQFAVLALIVSTMLIEYLAESGVVPRVLSFLPELIGGLVLLYVIFEGRRNRFRGVRGVYWLVFGAFALHIACGSLANHEEPGAVITGLRYFLRAIPLFFLPAVFDFTEDQIRRQLRWILAFCFLQVPATLYQLIFLGAMGDGMSGTLLLTSFLSPFLVCAACVLTGFRIRGHLKNGPYLIMLLLLLLPTSINETKITFILVPLGLSTVLLLGSRQGERLRNMAIAAVLSVALLVGFFTVYTSLQRSFEASGTTKATFDLKKFVTEGQYKDYLKTNSDLGSDAEYVGRIDALTVPLAFIAREPVTLWFGLGVGNASDSPLGDTFEGKYGPLFHNYMFMTATTLLLETGVGGLLMALMLMVLIFRDVGVVADAGQGLLGTIAAGWLGVIVLMFFLVFYADTIVSSPIAFLFWYFSGLIASERMRLAGQRTT